MAFKFVGTSAAWGIQGESPHEVFTDDLLKRYGVALHRFKDADGNERSAIYKYGVEVMRVYRHRELEMVCAYRRQMYRDNFGANNALM